MSNLLVTNSPLPSAEDLRAPPPDHGGQSQRRPPPLSTSQLERLKSDDFLWANANRNKRATQGYHMVRTVSLILGMVQEGMCETKGSFGPGHQLASYNIGNYRPGEASQPDAT